MNKAILKTRLFATPTPIRKLMLETHGKLPAGAVSVINRFFEILNERGEPQDSPSEQSFRDACKSESTFRLLLRTLAQFAPSVSTNAALAVKHEWVAKRPKKNKKTDKTNLRSQPENPKTANWPASWQVYYPSLKQAPLSGRVAKLVEI